MSSDGSRKRLLTLLVLLNLIILSGISYYNRKDKIVDESKVVLGSSMVGREVKFDTLGATINRAELIGIYIDDKFLGYVANKAEGNEVIEKVTRSYAKAMGIKKEDIAQVNVKGNIKYEKVTTDIKNLTKIDDIVDSITKDNMLCVDLTVKDTRNISIEPELEVKNTDDLVLGKKEVEDGSKGVKKQELKVTYRNGEEYETNVLSESIVTCSKNKVIYKGTGNPIAMGVAFLKEPTTGGIVTSQFGSRWGKMHNGIDIGNQLGKPVYAAFDGKVKRVFYDQYGYGKAVVIEHDKGLETRYAHLNNYIVKEGDTVLKGEKIGEVGNTGKSTGPHLHFELRQNGSPVNPIKYIE